tara:strand:- start:37 stop:354 length:318 start_codon:yes stop_codon:yes gene_type:complete
MSLIGPALFLKNRREYKSQLLLEKRNRTNNNFSSKVILAQVFKIQGDACFVKTNANIVGVLMNTSETMYMLNEYVNVQFMYDEAPYIGFSLFCLDFQKYFYVREV